MTAPSSASMVFNATIGSRSGQLRVPKSGWSAKRAKPAGGSEKDPARNVPSTNTIRGASSRQPREHLRLAGIGERLK